MVTLVGVHFRPIRLQCVFGFCKRPGVRVSYLAHPTQEDLSRSTIRACQRRRPILPCHRTAPVLYSAKVLRGGGKAPTVNIHRQVICYGRKVERGGEKKNWNSWEFFSVWLGSREIQRASVPRSTSVALVQFSQRFGGRENNAKFFCGGQPGLKKNNQSICYLLGL